ncbi:chaperone protein DnaJ-like [Macrobrachium nipponense]|uniref:chaperone protein DnaJ-like n=1 Tax=Macrobrachium nipponense TaxID=159736 RepID=UPI0030C85C8D
MTQLEKLDDQELVAAARTLQRMQRHGCPYYILGIAEEANLKEIKWAYRKRTLKFNPDNCQGSKDERQRRMDIMHKVNYANYLLCDTDERRKYNAVREFIKDLADSFSSGILGDSLISLMEAGGPTIRMRANSYSEEGGPALRMRANSCSEGGGEALRIRANSYLEAGGQALRMRPNSC